MMRFLVRMAAVFIVLGVAAAYAQPTLSQLQAELLSGWLVTVDGEARTRTLRISGVEQKDAGTFVLDAAYGWTDGNQTAVTAEISQSAQERTLILTTQPGSKIAAVQKPGGTFVGTFTSTSGQTKGVKIEKLSEDALQLKVTSMKAGSAAAILKTPAADVPASCSSLFGGWAGQWSAGGFGPQRLWIVAIDTNCIAKYSFRSTASSQIPTTFKTAEIKQGVLTVPCGSNGTCSFERHGDEAWGRYSDSSGDSNNGVFKKIY